MRHFRMPNQNINNLAILQKHIGSILNEISKYEKADRKKTIGKSNDCGPSTSKKVKGNNNRSKWVNGVKTFEFKKRRSKRRLKVVVGALNNNECARTTKISVKRVFLCRSCSVGNRSKASHLKHLNSHEGDPVSCIRCKRTFKNKDSFDWHLTQLCFTKVKEKTLYHCNECSKEFKTKRTLGKHLEGHKRNKCPYCFKALTTRKSLIEHLITSHSIKLDYKIHKCDRCTRRYARKQQLYFHLQQHLLDKLVCLQCGNICNCKEEYEEHMLNHENDKKFVCPMCKLKFLRKQHYLLHIKGHSRYKCITCNESFGSRNKAAFHKQRRHTVEGLHPRYICPHCPGVYHQKIRLHQHLKKHTDAVPNVFCKYCKITFDQKCAYYKHCLEIDHSKYQTETHKYQCEVCMKKFTKQYLLAKHYFVIHKVFREPFKCKYCSYTTFYKNNYERHEKLHLSHEKNYMCEQCATTFSSLASLQDHISYKHLQDKKFKCSTCDKSFKRVSELTRHEASHSNVRPHSCSLCNAAFKRKTHLQRHEKNVHNLSHQPQKTRKVKIQPDGTAITLTEVSQSSKKRKTDSNARLLKNIVTSEIDSLYSLQSEELSFESHENLTEQHFFLENIPEDSYEFLLDLTISNEEQDNLVNNIRGFD